MKSFLIFNLLCNLQAQVVIPKSKMVDFPIILENDDAQILAGTYIRNEAAKFSEIFKPGLNVVPEGRVCLSLAYIREFACGEFNASEEIEIHFAKVNVKLDPAKVSVDIGPKLFFNLLVNFRGDSRFSRPADNFINSSQTNAYWLPVSEMRSISVDYRFYGNNVNFVEPIEGKLVSNNLLTENDYKIKATPEKDVRKTIEFNNKNPEAYDKETFRRDNLILSLHYKEVFGQFDPVGLKNSKKRTPYVSGRISSISSHSHDNNVMLIASDKKTIVRYYDVEYLNEAHLVSYYLCTGRLNVWLGTSSNIEPLPEKYTFSTFKIDKIDGSDEGFSNFKFDNGLTKEYVPLSNGKFYPLPLYGHILPNARYSFEVLNKANAPSSVENIDFSFKNNDNLP